jgi:hypothetical protein
LGPLEIVGTGTTKRSPSALATNPPPQVWAKAIPAWASTRLVLAAGMVPART